MAILLRELIQDLPDARLHAGGAAGQAPPGDVEVKSVRDDSRAVEPGDVFVAVRGLRSDGHDYAADVARRGAAALVVERPLDVAIPQVVVPKAARALGWLAARACGRPSDRMTMVGITGTNGKTTTTYLVESILREAKAQPGVIGTVSYRFAGREIEAPYTTPTPLSLHPLLGQMAGEGTTHVVMETSSAALAMDRLEGLFFAVGAFTNLTQDHLDVHGTMQAYGEAKGRLFAERIAPGGTAVAMIDDDEGHGAAMLARAPSGVRRLRVSALGPSAEEDAEIRVLSAEATVAGLRARLATPRGELTVASRALLGAYNVANVALAIGVAEALGVPHDAIARGIERLPGVPGRVERVENPRGLDVFVDYAHTPDALERVIEALRPLTRGRLVVVFGCGGDRDPTKRPKMGRVVAERADVSVVTSDNPRTEAPQAIVDMILDGIRASGREPTLVEVDRRRAIGRAVAMARPGDVVLIAGKGHEDYQIVGTQKHHFDDREEAAAAMDALGAAT